MKRLQAATLIGAATATLVASFALAQNYPTRSIRIIDPFPPGGGTDFAARLVSQRLSESLGQQVVVENRPGAAGNIGTDVIAKGQPDGYLLGMGNNATLAINASLYRQLPYNPATDITPIALLAAYPYILVVHPSLPVRTVKELLALAKSRPGQLNFASAGSTTRLAGALLSTTAHLKVTDVPYNGTGPALTDLLGGHVDLMLLSTPSPHFSTGKLRAIAVTSGRRSRILPDLPTLSEAGVPKFDVRAWYGVIAPAGLTPAIVTRLNRDIVRILEQPDIRDRLAGAGAETAPGTAAEFGDLIRTEITRWAGVVKESGIPVQ